MTTNTRPDMPYEKTLETALKNAVGPSYNLYVTCPDCNKEYTTDNGEWLIWCGAKEHAEAVLKAARCHSNLIARIAELEAELEARGV